MKTDKLRYGGEFIEEAVEMFIQTGLNLTKLTEGRSEYESRSMGK